MKCILNCLPLVFGLLLMSNSSHSQDVDLSYSELRPLPHYPRQAAIDCIDGEVLAEFTVSSEGGAEQVKILRSTPKGVFDQVVLDVLRQWTIHAAAGTRVEKLFEFDLGLDHCRP